MWLTVIVFFHKQNGLGSACPSVGFHHSYIPGDRKTFIKEEQYTLNSGLYINSREIYTLNYLCILTYSAINVFFLSHTEVLYYSDHKF